MITFLFFFINILSSTISFSKYCAIFILKKRIPKLGEMNGASDNAYRSLHEFETLCLKQREEGSNQSNMQQFFEN